MNEWWQNRWFRRHAMFVPFGVFITTGLLTYFVETGPWGVRAFLKSAASMVDLGTVVYAMVAVSVERVIRMWFWALDQREKWREKWRREAQAEGRADLLNRMWAAAHAEGNLELAAQVEHIAREEGRSVIHSSPSVRFLAANPYSKLNPA